MKRKIIYFSILLAGIISTGITISGNNSDEDKHMKELKERLGEKWHIIEEKITEEYKNKRMKELEKERSIMDIEKGIADGTLSEETAKRIRRHLTLKRNFVKSNYFIVDEELVIAPKPPRLSAWEEKEVELINKALKAIEGRISIQDGAKVVVQSDEKHYIVIFEFILPEGEGVRGPSFSAKIIIDAKTGEILQILVGG